MASFTLARTTGRRTIAMLCAAAMIAGCSSTAPDATTADTATADAVAKVVEDTMAKAHLKSTLVSVSIDGQPVITRAFGQTMTGVPATTDMHFRNGAVAIAYMSTLLLVLVDEQKVRLDDKLSTWLPDFPHSDQVTLGQLAQMTSGYADFVLGNEAFANAVYANPFRDWSTEDQLAQIKDRPLLYPPGTNWNYSHTNYVLLGLALAKATGQDLATLLRDKVLDPLGLSRTVSSDGPRIPAPALHAFTSERRDNLRIPPGTPFYEESSFWNPSWTLAHGAIQTTTIADVEASARAIGSGKLLTEESYRAMVSTDLRGKTRKQPGCPTCDEMTDVYTYGLGIIITGDWLIQNPLFAGYAALMAYLPSRKISIAVAVTYDQAAFDDNGNYRNEADTVFRNIASELAPEDAPPRP